MGGTAPTIDASTTPHIAAILRCTLLSTEGVGGGGEATILGSRCYMAIHLRGADTGAGCQD